MASADPGKGKYLRVKGTQQDCIKHFGRLWERVEPLDAALLEQLEAQVERAGPRDILRGRYDVKLFIDSGWKELEKMAALEGKPVSILIREFEDFAMLYYQDRPYMVEKIQTGRMMNHFAMSWMEQHPKLDLDRIRTEDLQLVATIMTHVSVLARLAARAEIKVSGVTHVNFTRPLDAPQIRRIFHALDEYGEEATLVTALERDSRLKKLQEAQAKPPESVPEKAPLPEVLPKVAPAPPSMFRSR